MIASKRPWKTGCHRPSSSPSPQSSSSSTGSCLSFELSNAVDRNADVPESQEIVESPTETEHYRIHQARQRLARREVELRQIVRHCNGEMDVVRRKLCKDLQVMEVIREEIDKAGSGAMREQLEQDFHNEYLTYVSTLTRQKERVEEMQDRKQTAMKELEGIIWSDRVLQQRAEELGMEMDF